MFVEIKLASKRKAYEYIQTCKYFKGLFFQGRWSWTRGKTRDINKQIAEYPKPLLVIVFDVETGEELARRLFE